MWLVETPAELMQPSTRWGCAGGMCYGLVRVVPMGSQSKGQEGELEEGQLPGSLTFSWSLVTHLLAFCVS